MLSPVTTEKSQGKSGWQAVSGEWEKTEAILQGAKQKHPEQEKQKPQTQRNNAQKKATARNSNQNLTHLFTDDNSPAMKLIVLLKGVYFSIVDKALTCTSVIKHGIEDQERQL